MMTKMYFLRLSPEEVVRLLRAEIEEAHGQPELYLNGREYFLIEEDFDRQAYGLDGDIGYDLVKQEAEFTIEPRIEQDYWALSLVFSRDLGLQPSSKEDEFPNNPELTLDGFESRFLGRKDARVRVRLLVQTPEAKRHFDDWWSSINARHPAAAAAAGEKK
jgi:hypothetical protein